MRSPWLLVLTLLLASLVTCTPPEERAENARAAFQDAMTRGDRPGALQAVKDLRESAPDTAEGLLKPFKKVPFVNTTFLAFILNPKEVLTPLICSFSTISPVTIS